MSIPRLPAEIWRLVLDSMHCIRCPFNKFGEIELLHRLNINKHLSDNSIDILENAINIHMNELAINAKHKLNLLLIDKVHLIISIIYYIREDGDYMKINTFNHNSSKTTLYIYNLDPQNKERCTDNQIFINKNNSNIIIKEEWFSYRKLHNLYGPAQIEKYEDGTLKTQMWCMEGKIHSIYEYVSIDGLVIKRLGPALKRWYSDGTIQSLKWYKDNKFFNEDAPAILEYSSKGILIFEAWYKNGLENRDIHPAMIEWYDDGSIKSQKWCKNGKLHRIGNPALIRWNDNKIVLEEWYIDNKLHRIDGPASTRYTNTNNSIIKSEVWYKDEMVHRIDGPAVIHYKDDVVDYSEWFIEGRAIH